MESAELQTRAPATQAVSAKEPSNIRRFFEWFWGGRQWRELRELKRAASAQSREYRRRARASFELGRTALESTQGLAYGPHDALACELFRQCIYWLLLAQHEGEPKRDASESLETLWRSPTSAPFIADAADEPGARELVHQALVDADFRSYAELASDEQIRVGRRLADFCARLLENEDGLRRRFERLWLQRLLRLLLPVVALATVLGAVLFVSHRLEEARDLAKGKPWVASSKWPQGGCISPAQQCADSPDYFFCTNEEDSPWLEIDLGSKRPISKVTVINRAELPERAVPLVIETSVDHTKYREVIRRTEDFRTWRASFATTEARWVRLRVARRSFLHLLRVKIFE